MNKEKLNFKESCEFYCNYHKVSKTETAMICGNLGIVVDRLLKSQREEIVEKIRKGFIKTADNYILSSKIEPKLVLNKHQFWKMIKENLITKEDE